MLFNVMHWAVFVPLLVVGYGVGQVAGPLLGVVGGYHVWQQMREAHDEKLLSEKQVEELKRGLDAAGSSK